MNQLRRIKREKRFTYKELAEKSGLTPEYLSYLANGQRDNPSLKTMQKIADALGESVQTLFFGKE